MIALLGKWFSFTERFKNKCKRAYLLRCLRRHGENVYIGAGCIFNPPANIEVGSHVYFGANCVIQSVHGDIRIGSHVMLGPGVNIHGGNHKIDNLDGYMDEAKKQPGDDPEIVIGDDVWIGANAIILPGVTIGEGAVVGAGAVVTHNVEPYAVVAGNPATVLRFRLKSQRRKEF